MPAAAAAIRDAQPAAASPSRPRCSSRSRCCAATGAATAPSPSRRPGSTRRTSPPTRCSSSRAGAPQLGCFEALFTLGEAPEERYPQAAEWLAANGFDVTVDYLAAVAKRVLDETGLLPHANAGALSEAELVRLRAVSPSQGMMIETLADRLARAGRPALRRARQDAASAGSRPCTRPGGRGCRSPPASSSASARRATSGSTRWSRSRPRTSSTGTCRR